MIDIDQKIKMILSHYFVSCSCSFFAEASYSYPELNVFEGGRFHGFMAQIKFHRK